MLEQANLSSAPHHTPPVKIKNCGGGGRGGPHRP